MTAYCRFVDCDLPQQHRRYETPKPSEQVSILKIPAQVIHFNDIALDVEPAVDIGIRDNPFIKSSKGPDTFGWVILILKRGEPAPMLCLLPSRSITSKPTVLSLKRREKNSATALLCAAVIFLHFHLSCAYLPEPLVTRLHDHLE